MNRDAITSIRSSTTESQRVSSNLDKKRQSKTKLQIDGAPSEMEQTGQHVSSAPQLDNPEACSALLIDSEQVKNNSGGEALPVTKADQVSALPVPQVACRIPHAPETEQNQEVDGAVCMMPSLANKDRASKKKESKMAKRSGYIVLTFLLFWLPLITTILVNFLVRKNKSAGMGAIWDVEILSVSVACMTSLSDPIIYAAVNPQFRTEFYRLKNRLRSS
ncbi:uncharacterized protein [Centroberyx affinis]|uniref:uncharacterized protein n=1 Tax=Centroberyx affinis TaxID=166261 RepID=UPI003A5BE477